MSSNRWLIAAGLALGLLVVASVLVGGARRAETEFPADSAEGAVQHYVRAVQDGDATAIQDLLSPSARERCELADIRSALRSPSDREYRVTLRDVKVTDSTAVVRVRVTENTGSGPFESGSYDHDETFDLVRASGAWLIDQPTWPVYCPPKIVPTVVIATPSPAPTSPPTSTPVATATSTATGKSQ